MVNRLHQSSDCLVDAAGYFLAGSVQHIAIDINGSLFQCFRQVKLGVTVAFPHLHALCFLNGLILGKLHRSILAQEPLNFQVCPHFRQERIIIRQNHKDFLALTREQAQRTIIGAALIPRGQHTEADIVILVCLIGAVIHCLIEGERIPSTEAWVLILLAGENVLIDHLRNLRDDLRHLHIFFFDFVVDFLFLIGQEYIDGAILLDQHLAHQHFQCIFHLCFQRDTIIVNAGNHQADDVVHVGFDLQNIFNQEKGLQHIDGKDIFFLLFRVDIAVVISADNHAAVAVVEEVLQCIIEPIERHDCPHLIVHQLHGRLFEQSQHGTFTFGQVLAGCTVGTNAGQHTGKQIKLVWNKRINLSKIFCVGVQFFLHTVVEDNQIFDDGCFLVIEQTQALGCGLCLIQNTLFDNSVHIGRGQRKTCIETSLNLGEVVTLHLGNGVDILLARYDYPSLTHAFLAQFFRHCLKVQHQFGIITNVLANLIYKENHMVVVTFFINIGLHSLGKILNADLVALGCFLAPVTGS